MMKARTKPTASPNKIPNHSEWTLRAKKPIATPAMMPFTVEPMMMPTIPARTAGVNHEVAPSMAPRIAPRTIPSRTLFITASVGGDSLSAHRSLQRRRGFLYGYRLEKRKGKELAQRTQRLEHRGRRETGAGFRLWR